ncbi:MAG: glycosyltransferase [Planctomycetota bacterium]
MTRIAIVHEWFTRWAGSEQVLEHILHCLPNADLFAITSRPDAEGQRKLAGRKVHTSFIQRLPLGARAPQLWLPLLPLAAEQLDLRGYDVVLSNSHCVAKGVIAGPDARHFAYIHTPMRYAWDLQHEYQSRIPWLLRPLWARQMKKLRAWDAMSATRVDHIACNSAYIARRIRRAWRRDADVLYPPVDIEAFTPGGAREDVYLTASRLVPYKHIPLIAEAFARMPGRRLTVIGDGADLGRVRAIARSHANIEVLGHVPRTELIARMRHARAFVFAAEEDFGIAPVEAQACGTPVIAFGRGGACETVVDGKTGLHFDTQTPAAIIAAVERFEKAPAPEAAHCRANAELFSSANFRSGLLDFLRRSGITL